MLLRNLQEEPPGDTTIVLDLTNLTLIHDVGARMLFEGVERLQQDGHRVVVVDSEGLLSQTQIQKHAAVLVQEELERYLQQYE